MAGEMQKKGENTATYIFDLVAHYFNLGKITFSGDFGPTSFNTDFLV